MKHLTILPCLFLVFTACQKTAQDLPETAKADEKHDASHPLRSYTFDRGTQGWIEDQIGGYVSWANQVGNPPGSLRGMDVGAKVQDGNIWYFKAPGSMLNYIKWLASFHSLGNVKLAFDMLHLVNLTEIRGETLAYIALVKCPTFQMIWDDYDVVAEVYNGPRQWFTLPIPLTRKWYILEAGGTRREATYVEMLEAWSTITELKILGDWFVGRDGALLDNVRIE